MIFQTSLLRPIAELVNPRHTWSLRSLKMGQTASWKLSGFKNLSNLSGSNVAHTDYLLVDVRENSTLANLKHCKLVWNKFLSSNEIDPWVCYCSVFSIAVTFSVVWVFVLGHRLSCKWYKRLLKGWNKHHADTDIFQDLSSVVSSDPCVVGGTKVRNLEHLS